ncbi:transposase family protein [Streptomyces sp. NPDC056402]|uniref:transposase family protein n=1 Tax=Streptomyces sp. NPDC056402 TaxID=3345810 RepID=UPI0035DD5037
MCRQSATVCLVKSPTRRHRATGPLAERLATLADPRCWRGRRHPFVAVLLIACSAVVTGATSFVAITEWASEAPQDVLARLGARTATALAVCIPPSGATVRRVIKDTCPGGLADLLGHDPAGTDTLALDGKTARGSRLGTIQPGRAPAGRGHRHRDDRHPAQGPREDERDHMLRRPPGPL